MDNIVSEVGRLGPRVAVGLFVILFILEHAYPLRLRKGLLPRRAAINLLMTGVVFLVGTYVVRRYALALSYSAGARGYGLLGMVPMPSWAGSVLGFLLMDLTFYYWHRANHEVVLLWRFHAVHHVDPDLDVTTSFRFHFAEVLYSLGFRVAQVGIIGVAPATYVVYELVFTCGTMFHHSNIRLPLRAERLLNKVFVTPRMHGIHHSAVERETNSNYSVVFRWWDRLHGTLELGVRQSEITIGVPAFLGPEDNRLAKLLAMPFLKRRDYWRMPDGRAPAREGAADGRLMME